MDILLETVSPEPDPNLRPGPIFQEHSLQISGKIRNEGILDINNPELDSKIRTTTIKIKIDTPPTRDYNYSDYPATYNANNAYPNQPGQNYDQHYDQNYDQAPNPYSRYEDLN